MGLTIREMIEVCEILERACGGDARVTPGDGVLYVGEPGAEVTLPQRLALEQMGWHVSADNGRWCKVTG